MCRGLGQTASQAYCNFRAPRAFAALPPRAGSREAAGFGRVRFRTANCAIAVGNRASMGSDSRPSAMGAGRSPTPLATKSPLPEGSRGWRPLLHARSPLVGLGPGAYPGATAAASQPGGRGAPFHAQVPSPTSAPGDWRLRLHSGPDLATIQTIYVNRPCQNHWRGECRRWSFRFESVLLRHQPKCAGPRPSAGIPEIEDKCISWSQGRRWDSHPGLDRPSHLQAVSRGGGTKEPRDFHVRTRGASSCAGRWGGGDDSHVMGRIDSIRPAEQNPRAASPGR